MDNYLQKLYEQQLNLREKNLERFSNEELEELNNSILEDMADDVVKDGVDDHTYLPFSEEQKQIEKDRLITFYRKNIKLYTN